ncbi:5734_t:CDS:1, partial [Paraglomus brasilianum]
GQTKKGKEKGPEISTASSENSKVLSPQKGNRATPTTFGPATVAQQFSATTATGSGSGPEAHASKATPTLLREGTHQFQRADMEEVENELPPELRATTPPPFIVVDPDTPRKGDKRMAKEDSWNPSAEEVDKYIQSFNLCALCWEEGHHWEICPNDMSDFSLAKVMKHPEFQPYLYRWQRNRKKRGRTWLLEEHTTEATVVIPPYCITCKVPGHMSNDVECPGK